MSGKLVPFYNLYSVSSLRIPTSQRLTAAAATTAPRHFSTTCGRRQNDDAQSEEKQKPSENEEEKGAMSRKLAEMTEEAMLEGGRSARRNIEQAGFSEDLKKQLEERIAATSFKNDYAAAHSIVNMPESAGQGTRDHATAPAWTGEESLHDVTLRMLDSSKKRMRTPSKTPQLKPVDFRFSQKPPKSPGMRIAKAKENTDKYILSESPGLTDAEREAMRREMRERFSPGARPMPISFDGLASLANERIEDAMARGQFDKIKRGKGVNVKTDHNANSAYIDTTEYFMNKITQSQEVVPPWVEKQQERAREIERFRERLRVDWRRHAARLIASEGGSLDAQMKRAQAYAAAEARLVEQKKIEAALRDGESPSTDANTEGSSQTETQPAENLPYLPPLRDPQYLSTDRSYHELAIQNLNTLTRSYNLQAPAIAQKPYLDLERELASCFADVAPTLPEEIRRRATEKVVSPGSTVESRTSSFMGSLSTAQTKRVYDEDKSKGYGFKELLRDLFSKK